jgi:hypothetical protein
VEITMTAKRQSKTSHAGKRVTAPDAKPAPKVARGKNHASDLPLRAEYERLQKHVLRLEEEHARDRQAMKALQAEWDCYRRTLHASMQNELSPEGLPFSKEELQRWAEEEDETNCQTLDQFLGELESSATESKPS